MSDLEVGMILGGGGVALVIGTFAYRWAITQVTYRGYRSAKAAVPVARRTFLRALGSLFGFAVGAALVLTALGLAVTSKR